MSEFANTPAVEMPYGRKRALEIATTLALDPEMMLLDEPMAGMGHEDIDKIAALIKRISAKYTILMVEHNLSVVANLSDIITRADARAGAGGGQLRRPLQGRAREGSLSGSGSWLRQNWRKGPWLRPAPRC